MWWAGSERVDVFLGVNRLGVQRGGATPQWTAGASVLDLWCDAMDTIRLEGRTTIRAWLGGGLARPFVVPSLDGLRRIGDVRLVAASRAGEETGLSHPYCVSVEPWRVGEPAVCTAMEESLRTEIMAVERNRNVRVASIRPWWAAVLCGKAADSASLGVLTIDDGDSLVALGGAEGRLDVASVYMPPLDAEQRAALVQRVLFTVGGGEGVTRHVCLAASDEPSTGRTDPSCPFGPVWYPPA